MIELTITPRLHRWYEEERFVIGTMGDWETTVAVCDFCGEEVDFHRPPVTICPRTVLGKLEGK